MTDVQAKTDRKQAVTDWTDRVAGKAVFLTVNQRLARHYLSRYQAWQSASGNLWWESPAILPLNAWMTQMYTLATATGRADRHLVPEIVARKAWKTLLSRHASATLLDTDSAAHLAEQAWQLGCAWRCRNNQAHYLSLDQFTWQRWLGYYTEWLEQKNCIDNVMLPDVLSDLLSDADFCTHLPAEVLYDGFLQLTPQLRELFDALQGAGMTLTQIDRQPAGSVHRLGFTDDGHELLEIARHMRAELEHNDQQSLGLVVPDLQSRRHLVIRAFDRVFFPGQSPDAIRRAGRPYELSLGEPLSEQPVVATAMLILKLCHGTLRGTELSALLLSPHWLGADAESHYWQTLDRRLREKGIRSMELATLQEQLYADSTLKKVLSRLLAENHASASLGIWAARFDDWLRQFGWPRRDPDSEEHQAIVSWMECLDDLQVLDDGEALSVQQAYAELQTLVQERIFQLETPAAPIQILGRLESHGLAFDCLWISGMDDEQWPPSATPNPFLAIAEQQASGVPQASALARLQLAEQEYSLWASQAPVMFVCHAGSRDGKTLQAARLPEIPSSLSHKSTVAQHLARVERPAGDVDESLLEFIRSTFSVELVNDNYGPALPSGSQVAGGARLFEDQALCPFRAFARYRLAIRPLEEPGPGLDARQHGTLLHASLEKFWQAVKSHHELSRMTGEQIDDALQHIVREVLQDVVLPEDLRQLEQTRLSQLLHHWIAEYELPRMPFDVMDLELEKSIEHGGIHMNVILDRIDRVGDSLIVVDYKTGTRNQVSGWAEDRIVNPQLPLYVLADVAISGAAFAQIAPNKSGFIGVAAEEDLLPGVSPTIKSPGATGNKKTVPSDWMAWRQHWKLALDEIALEVRQGLASVTPVKGACTHCELKPLCRVDESARSDESAEGDSQDYGQLS
ncbi:MAG: PD-(D/E)XK nuclease family protein [Granulosicoccus sp.]